MAIDSLLSNVPAPADQATAHPNLDTVRKLASQFESMLLAQMLRDMQFTGDKSEEGMNFGGPLADTVLSELASSLTKAGGFGLAKSLEAAMVRTTPGMAQTAVDPADVRTVTPATLPDALPAVLPGAVPGLAITPARVSSAYGWRQDPLSGDRRMHHGIDIPLAHGDDVRSVGAGRVVESAEKTGYGQTVVIDHGDGLTTRYAHLSARHVAVGDVVGASTVLGLAGKTGRATGTHLHLEVRSNGVSVDPLGIKQFAGVADDVHKEERKP